MTSFKVEIQEAETPDIEIIRKNLRAYNVSQAGAAAYTPLTISFRDDSGEVIGGLVAKSAWNWIFIELLWVDAAFRGQGLGQKLMMMVEEFAGRHGCNQIYLDTFSFQAPGFYQKLGFQKFGELKDFPIGHSRSFFVKSLG